MQATSTFVSVPVRMQSEPGEAAPDPEAERLRVLDNGVPQRAISVRTSDLPISLVILMQTGGTGRAQFASYTDLAGLLGRITDGPTHEVTFVSFDSKVEEIWHFPRQSDGMIWSLEHPHPGDDGAAIRDAVSFGVRQLQAEPGRYRRIVLLLSQEADRGSGVSPTGLIEQLGVASTVVYSLTFGASKAKGLGVTKALSPGLSAAVRLVERNSASEIGALTGGDCAQFNDRRSFNSALLQVIGDIRNTRTLGFQPSQHTPGFHTIRVQSEAPGRVNVVSRTAYWFLAPGEQQ